jgi:hypothetical protein
MRASAPHRQQSIARNGTSSAASRGIEEVHDVGLGPMRADARFAHEHLG